MGTLVSDHSLDDFFEISGQWFLPESPEQRVHGLLRYSSRGSELLLDGMFRELDSVYSHRLHSYPVIHGITRDGKAVSLFMAYQSGMQMGTGLQGVHFTEQLRSSQLVFGAHTQPDFQFQKMRLRIPGLQHWLSQPVVERRYEKDKETGVTTSHVRLLPVAELVTRIPSIDADLEWEIYCHDSNVLDPIANVRIDITAWIAIRPDTPQPIDWYFQQMAKLNTLLCFMAGVSMSPDRIEAYDKIEREPASILFTFGNRKCCELTQQRDFFLPLSNVGPPLEQLLQTWFEVFPAIQAPTALAESVFSSGRERLWIHMEFLAWMQALEGLQRALPTGLMPCLTPRRRNRPTLRERMDALTGMLPNGLRNLILDEEKVPQSWIDTRDYYTHWIEEKRPIILDTEGIWDAIVRAKTLMVTLFLHIAGVPEEAFAKAFQGGSDLAQGLMVRKAVLDHQRNPNSSAGLIMAVHRADGQFNDTVTADETDAPVNEQLGPNPV